MAGDAYVDSRVEVDSLVEGDQNCELHKNRYDIQVVTRPPKTLARESDLDANYQLVSCLPLW